MEIDINEKYGEKLADFTFLYSPGINSFVPQISRYVKNVKHEENSQVYNIKKEKAIQIITDNYKVVKYAEITEADTYFKSIFGKTFSFFNSKIDKVNDDGYNYFIDISKINLGQELDIEEIKKTYEEIIKESPNAKIICFGVSRGCAALINFIALHKPTNICGIILEGGPSSIQQIYEYSTGIRKVFYNLVRNLISYTSSYNHNGPHPIDNVCKLPKNIPILFVTSINDLIVPYQCSLNMYNKMIDKNFENVDIVILSESGHNDYLYNNNDDIHKYVEAICDFYEKIDKNIIPSYD